MEDGFGGDVVVKLGIVASGTEGECVCDTFGTWLTGPGIIGL